MGSPKEQPLCDEPLHDSPDTRKAELSPFTRGLELVTTFAVPLVQPL